MAQGPAIGKRGAQGPSGAPGAPGGTMSWKGEWNNYTAYVVNDAVYYNGSGYYCILGNTNNLPTDPTYWSIFAQGSVVTNFVIDGGRADTVYGGTDTINCGGA